MPVLSVEAPSSHEDQPGLAPEPQFTRGPATGRRPGVSLLDESEVHERADPLGDDAPAEPEAETEVRPRRRPHGAGMMQHSEKIALRRQTWRWHATRLDDTRHTCFDPRLYSVALRH